MRTPAKPSYSRNYWVAFLSNGQQVYEDRRPNEESPWLRLKKYVKKHNLKINKVNLHAYGLTVSTPLNPEGVFYARKAHHLTHPELGLKDWTDIGVGHVENGKITIMWATEEKKLKPEVRDYKPEDIGVILNSC